MVQVRRYLFALIRSLASINFSSNYVGHSFLIEL